MMPIIVSYHTPFHVYETCARNLEDSLNKFELRYEINCLPSEGDWYQNACQKTTYIREMMDRHPEEDIIWLDADMVVLSYPHLFESVKADVACPLWEKSRVMACAIYFKNTPKVRNFVDCLIETTYENAYHVQCDQYAFSLTLRKHQEISFEAWPESYSFIERCGRDIPYVDGPPVILAETISRTINRVIPE